MKAGPLLLAADGGRLLRVLLLGVVLLVDLSRGGSVGEDVMDEALQKLDLPELIQLAEDIGGMHVSEVSRVFNTRATFSRAFAPATGGES